MLPNVMQLDGDQGWMAACAVQQRFMECSQPTVADVDYSAECRQMEEVGGDFYYFLPRADGRLVFAIGDASGKGLAAALMISSVQSMLRAATSFTDYDGAPAVRMVNRLVHESSLADRYATLFYGVFDQERRTLRYVNAGHTPPMVVRGDGTVCWLETGGAPVGMFSDWKYEEGVIGMKPEDILVACTDGITEACDARGEEWGMDGLNSIVARCGSARAKELVSAVFASMDAYTGGVQNDDATVLAVRVC